MHWDRRNGKSRQASQLELRELKILWFRNQLTIQSNKGRREGRMLMFQC